MRNIGIVFILVYTMFVSGCAKKKHILEQNNINTIASLVLDDVVSKIVIESAFSPQPPDPRLNLEEMIETLDKERSIPKDTVKTLQRILKEQGKIVVALDTFSHSLNRKKLESQKCIDTLNLKDSFKLNNKSIDVSILEGNEYSDIIFYKKGTKWIGVKNTFNFNVIVSISKISFDDKNLKAIVTLSVGYNPLSGYSMLYYLEKKNGSWKIECKI